MTLSSIKFALPFSLVSFLFLFFSLTKKAISNYEFELEISKATTYFRVLRNPDKVNHCTNKHSLYDGWVLYALSAEYEYGVRSASVSYDEGVVLTTQPARYSTRCWMKGVGEASNKIWININYSINSVTYF